MIAEELKQNILLKTGLTNITSRDCHRIALNINQSLNKHISVTTLKRVFGFAKSNHHFSKYTIAALSDYAGADFFLPTKVASIASGHLAEVKVMSFISETYFQVLEFTNQTCLSPNQLVLEGLDILLKDDREFLPLVKTGKCIGVVYTKDLIYFLSCHDHKYGTLYHKFNFDLQSAILALCKT